MHTKSLVTLKQMLVERNAVRKSKLGKSGLDSKTKSQLDLASLDKVPANTRKSHADLQVRSVRVFPACSDAFAGSDYVHLMMPCSATVSSLSITRIDKLGVNTQPAESYLQSA